jgi:hypothetical protein
MWILSLKTEVFNLMDNNDLPDVSPKLISSLDNLFPDRCPRIDDKDRMVWFKAGQRSVVEVLIEHHKRQIESNIRKT